MAKTRRPATAQQPTSDPRLTIVRRPLASLRPDPNNPRTHDETNLAAIKGSIDTFGQVEPLTIQKGTGRIIAGHGRLEAMLRRGDTEADVVEIDCTDEQATALGIAMNRTGELAGWDMPRLAAQLQALPQDLLTATGYDGGQLTEMLEQINPPQVVEDEPPEPAPDAVTVKGDLWLLGSHRLLCGDSTDGQTVKRLMAGQRAVLFATDPPYLVGYTGDDRPKKAKDWSKTYGITWDDADENPELYDKFVDAAKAFAIDDNAAWYCWHASKMHAMVEAVWNKHGAFVHQQIIWAKNRPIITYSWYLWQTEPCLMGWIKGNKPHRATASPTSNLWSTTYGEGRGVKDMSREELERVLMEYSDLWQIDTIHPGQDMGHPTSKPVEIFAIPMRRHTEPGDVCYEPFSGSGSQISAGEQLRRRVYAMEISPTYVDVAIRRWQALTGKAATHAETGRTWEQTASDRKKGHATATKVTIRKNKKAAKAGV